MLDSSNKFVRRLEVVKTIWDYQKTLTTFILTFFLNQAYAFWKGVFHSARHLQDRLEDYHLLLATNVYRNEDGTLPPKSQQLLEDVGQYSRLFHILAWAAIANRFQVLSTTVGLERMTSRGILTVPQLDLLTSLEGKVPSHELYYAPLEWMMIRINQAMDQGILAGDTATKGKFLDQTSRLRGDSALGEKLAGRMPLAYVHLGEQIGAV